MNQTGEPPKRSAPPLPTSKPADKGPEEQSKPNTGAMVARLVKSEDHESAKAMAELATRPSLQATMLVRAYQGTSLGGKALEAAALVQVIDATTKVVQSGDLRHVEAMLMAQAEALQAMFMNMARQGHAAEWMPHMEAYTRLGLKAQAQCRATLETLAVIKNPPTVFARQANITSGPQQVNNGVAPVPAPSPSCAPAPAIDSTSAPTELFTPKVKTHVPTLDR